MNNINEISNLDLTNQEETKQVGNDKTLTEIQEIIKSGDFKGGELLAEYEGEL